MKKHFEYHGYLGSAEISVEDGVLFGKLLFIRDTITYEATNVQDLEVAFREAVDDYLETCRELNDEPDTPCKGSFNVRVGPQLHRDVALAARCKGMGLNEYVCAALTSAVNAEHQSQHIHHHHEVTVQVSGVSKQRVASAGMQPHEWESMNVATSH